MANFWTKCREIRNVFFKTLFMIVGTGLVVSTLYPFILENFLLTDKQEVWDWTEWKMLGVGFFLTFGGYKFNTIIDFLAGLPKALVNKTKNGSV